ERRALVGRVRGLRGDEASEAKRRGPKKAAGAVAADLPEVGEHADRGRRGCERAVERRGGKRRGDRVEQPEGMELPALRVGIRRVAAEDPRVPAAEPTRRAPPPGVVRDEEDAEIGGCVGEA